MAMSTGLHLRTSQTLALTPQLQQSIRLLQLSTVRRKEQGDRQFAPVDLVQVVQNCCFSRLTQARSKAIDLGYDGIQQPVIIDGDEVLLGELCANLLENAIKYTPAGGIVTVFLHTDAGGVELSVEDSGPGIEDSQIHQAVLPFHRLDNVGDASGSGIGLALASDIARLHRSHLQLSRSEALGGLSVKMRFLLLT